MHVKDLAQFWCIISAGFEGMRNAEKDIQGWSRTVHIEMVINNRSLYTGRTRIYNSRIIRK